MALMFFLKADPAPVGFAPSTRRWSISHAYWFDEQSGLRLE